MADVAVITPATNFSETGKAMYAREQPRFPEPTVRVLSSASSSSNKEMAHREKPPANKQPSVRKAWGRMTPSNSVSEGSSQRVVEGEVTNGRDGTTIEIPHDAKVCFNNSIVSVVARNVVAPLSSSMYVYYVYNSGPRSLHVHVYTCDYVPNCNHQQ